MGERCKGCCHSRSKVTPKIPTPSSPSCITSLAGCEWHDEVTHDEIRLSGKGKEMLQMQLRSQISCLKLIKRGITLSGSDLNS